MKTLIIIIILILFIWSIRLLSDNDNFMGRKHKKKHKIPKTYSTNKPKKEKVILMSEEVSNGKIINTWKISSSKKGNT